MASNFESGKSLDIQPSSEIKEIKKREGITTVLASFDFDAKEIQKLLRVVNKSRIDDISIRSRRGAGEDEDVAQVDMQLLDDKGRVAVDGLVSLLISNKRGFLETNVSETGGSGGYSKVEDMSSVHKRGDGGSIIRSHNLAVIEHDLDNHGIDKTVRVFDEKGTVLHTIHLRDGSLTSTGGTSYAVGIEEGIFEAGEEVIKDQVVILDTFTGEVQKIPAPTSAEYQQFRKERPQLQHDAELLFWAKAHGAKIDD